MIEGSRRRLLCTLATGTALGTAGCTSILSSDTDTISNRADERVDGTWGVHNKTPGNTRRTTVTGPATEPSIRWRRSVGKRPFVDPLVDDSLVYEFAPKASTTITIEAATGERTTLPTVDGRTEFVLAIGDDTTCLTRPADAGSEVVARDASTGEQRWAVPVPSAPSPRATVTDDTLYASGFAGQWLRALDLTDGSERWSFETVGRTGSVAIAYDVVAFTTGRHLIGLDRETGERRWNEQFETRFSTDPLVCGDVVAAGTSNGHLVALRRSGETAWETAVSGSAVETLVGYENEILAGTSAGVVAHAADGGTTLRKRTSMGHVSGVSAGDRRLYLADDTPSLIAVDAADLSVEWSASLPDSLVGGPVVLPDHVVVRVAPIGTESGENDSSTLVAYSID